MAMTVWSQIPAIFKLSIKRVSGSTERTCGAPGSGGCPQSGKW